MINQQLTAGQKVIFSNLKQALTAFPGASEKGEELAFVVWAVEDQPAHYTSTDDLMRLTVYKESNLKNRRWDIATIVPLLTAPHDKFPRWVELSLLDATTIEMRVSRRFRHIRELRNQETGHPPFKLAKHSA